MLSISNLFSQRIRLIVSLAIALWLFSIYYIPFPQLRNPAIPEADYAPTPPTGPLAPVLTAQDLLSQPLARSLTDVPRLIHQSWKNHSLSPQFSAWSQTWRQQHPDWMWVFWTDADNHDLVVKYFPWFLDNYNRLPTDICRADVARNMYMFVYGGMYADLDFECLRPFDSLLQAYKTTLAPSSPSADPVFTHSHLHLTDHTQHAFFAHMGSVHDRGAHFHSVPNAWMASSPGHPFFTFVLRTLQRKMDDPVNVQLPTTITHPLLQSLLRFFRLTHAQVPAILEPTPEELTGPVALHQGLTSYSGTTDIVDDFEISHPAIKDLTLRNKLFGNLPDDMVSKVHVLPKELIYPYSWAKETRRYKKVCEASSRAFDAAKCKDKVDVVGKGSYSITYWSHSWGKPW